MDRWKETSTLVEAMEERISGHGVEVSDMCVFNDGSINLSYPFQLSTRCTTLEDFDILTGSISL